MLLPCLIFIDIIEACTNLGAVCFWSRVQVRRMSTQMLPREALPIPGSGATADVRTRESNGRHRSTRGPRQPGAAPHPLSAETRAAKSLAVIVLLFVVSWIPLYTLNTLMCLWPDLHVPEAVIKFGIILSHFNSAWNPALYAWGMRDFKHCLRKLLVHFHKPRTLIAML